jgi:hypothetical protein
LRIGQGQAAKLVTEILGSLRNPKFDWPEQRKRLQYIVTGKILKNLVSLDHLRRASKEGRELIRKYWENQAQQLPPITDSTSVAARKSISVGFDLIEVNHLRINPPLLVE